MNTNKKEKFINKNNAVHKRFWQIGIRTFFVFLFVIIVWLNMFGIFLGK